MALEKGTEEWVFWSEFFQLCKKYWDVSKSEEYWDGLMRESNELYEKHKTIFSSKMIFAFIETQEERYKMIRDN